MNITQFFGDLFKNSLFGIILGMMCVSVWISLRFWDQKKKAEDELLMFANKGDFFMKRKYMRDDEYEFYQQLQRIIGSEYYLYPQVHLSSIIDIKNNFKDHDNLYLLLGNKSVDYVVLSKQMFPLLVIELNGKSHFWNTRRNRDRLVESLVTKIGIKFLAINKDFMDIKKIEHEINSNLPTIPHSILS